ncbi:hypothetical protein T10_8694 [Trichinella papuae]|uniref:Uncharacterized protein n=1 Tax=Trichinella papuae TaxID=268474 RepID=A0A0V1M078_9BILA|nr:hypothetical protein T10_8694 [Trichinella papuae]
MTLHLKTFMKRSLKGLDGQKEVFPYLVTMKLHQKSFMKRYLKSLQRMEGKNNNR